MGMSITSHRQRSLLPNENEEEIDFTDIKLMYRAEGNANLVFSLPELGKILRLPKNDIRKGVTDINVSYPQIGILDDDFITSEINNENGKKQSYISPYTYVQYTNILAEFFGPEYVSPPDVVKISSSQCRRKIQKACENFRPAHRLHKDFSGDCGLLLPDATLLPDISVFDFEWMQSDTIAIEIKPKQGWKLPTGNKIFDAKVSEQSSVKCRYCAMQDLKLKNCAISKLRGFCPIDLFSGKSERMEIALDALLESPQNNLKIFRNGDLIYGDHADSMSYGCLRKSLFPETNGNLNLIKLLIVRCLLKNFKDSNIDEMPSAEIKSKNTYLPKNCILDKIFRLQLLAKENLELMSSSHLSFQASKSYTCLGNLLNKQKLFGVDRLILSPEEQYLLGATALDCSIILAFREIQTGLKRSPNGQHIISLPEYGKSFLCKATVVDLDPKPDNHIRKYIKKTNDAYRCGELAS